MRAIGICGLGGSGKELYELIRRINAIDSRWDEICFIDKTVESPGRIYRGCKVYTFEEAVKIFNSDEIQFSISVGDVFLRKKIYSQIKDSGYNLATIVAPNVYVSDSTVLYEGVIIRENSFISVDVTIKQNTMIQPNVAIGHDVIVGEHSIISAQCSLAGGVTIGNNTYIALNSSVKELITIGSNSIIAMGSVVNRNVEDNIIVAGNPIKVLSRNYFGSAFRLNREKKRDE